MALFTFTEGLWIFIGLAAFWFYGLIGAWIGYRRHKTFYRHCNDKEDEYPVVCYLITVFSGHCGFLMTAHAPASKHFTLRARTTNGLSKEYFL